MSAAALRITCQKAARELEVDGKDSYDRESGMRDRSWPGPTQVREPRDSEVTLFTITDGQLVHLRRPSESGKVERRVLGEGLCVHSVSVADTLDIATCAELDPAWLQGRSAVRATAGRHDTPAPARRLKRGPAGCMEEESKQLLASLAIEFGWTVATVQAC